MYVIESGMGHDQISLKKTEIKIKQMKLI